MAKHGWLVAGLLVLSLSLSVRSPAQTATPASLAAAKELIVEIKVAEHIKMLAPAILQQQKPLIARGNPLIERDFDALMPFVISSMNERLDVFLNAAAQLYAKQFTADEIKEVLTFYRTSTGQKMLQKLPAVTLELQAISQQFGQAVASDAMSRMTDELRKRGHDI